MIEHDGRKTPHVIHVNRHHIAANKKDGGNRPVYTIKPYKYGKPVYCREVSWQGASRAVYDGSSLSCGARAWVEVWSDLELTDEMTYMEAKNE